MSNCIKALLILIVLFLCPISYALCQQENFLSNKAGGKVVWYPMLNKPHACYFDGFTYVVFHGGGENYLDPMIVSYNHKTGEVLNGKVGENPLSEFDDSHGNPAVMVDNKGYIHVFYGGHGYYKGAKMTHAVSTKPGSIDSWKVLDNINPKGTYPQLLKMSDGTIYFFYRAENKEAGNHRGDWVYVVSNDNGLSFSEEKSILSGGLKRNDKKYLEGPYYDAWYVTFHKGYGDVIHAVAHYHPCSLLFGKDPNHARRRFHLYYLNMKHGTGKWTNFRSEELQLPLSIEYGDLMCRLLKSEGVKNKEKIIRFSLTGFDTDQNENPHFVFSYGREQNGKMEAVKEMMAGNLKTGELSMHSVPALGRLTIEEEGSKRIWGEKIYESTDSETWEEIADLTKYGLSGLSMVFNAPPNARFVAHDRTGKKSGRKIFMWGKEGFIFEKKPRKSQF